MNAMAGIESTSALVGGDRFSALPLDSPEAHCFDRILADELFPRRSFPGRSGGQCNLGLPDLKTMPCPVGLFLRCGRNLREKEASR